MCLTNHFGFDTMYRISVFSSKKGLRLLTERVLVLTTTLNLIFVRKRRSCLRDWQSPYVGFVVFLHGHPPGESSTLIEANGSFFLATLWQSPLPVDSWHGDGRQQAESFAEQQDGLSYLCRLWTTVKYKFIPIKDEVVRYPAVKFISLLYLCIWREWLPLIITGHLWIFYKSDSKPPSVCFMRQVIAHCQ